MNSIERRLISAFSKIRYRKSCVIEKNAIVYGKCSFEGMNKISPGAHITNSSLGYASYIGKNSVFSHAQIGRFCSIGDNVVLIRAKHPINEFASTHPAFYSTSTRCSFVTENKYRDIEEDEYGLSVRIGSDVWIGSNVLIKAGIRIGNGAIIAMGAVVTKDVPDYSIVAGVPGQVIRYRFPNIIVDQLLLTKWWEKDLVWIRNNAHAFQDVNMLLTLLETEK